MGCGVGLVDEVDVFNIDPDLLFQSEPHPFKSPSSLAALYTHHSRLQRRLSGFVQPSDAANAPGSSRAVLSHISRRSLRVADLVLVRRFRSFVIFMNNTPMNCPKCSGAMIQGFLPDNAYGAIVLGSWHEGPPKKSWWRGVTAPAKDSLPIRGFRCSGCGYLELYANKSFQAE